MHQICPELKTENLIKCSSYYDSQMDGYQLGLCGTLSSHKHFYILFIEGRGHTQQENNQTWLFKKTLKSQNLTRKVTS